MISQPRHHNKNQNKGQSRRHHSAVVHIFYHILQVAACKPNINAVC